MPLSPLNEVLGRKRAAHLLRRATFGGTKNDIDAMAALTPSEAIDILFHTTLASPLPPIDPKTGSEWMTTGTTDANSMPGALESYYLSWHIAQMMGNGQTPGTILSWSAREKITWFLHTHFTTIKSKVNSTRALYFQNQLFRKFALDGAASDPTINFKSLTVKISVDNAMLKLLDGELNVEGNPNENYARELLELYTIGRGLEGTIPDGLPQGDYFVYTEKDVQAAARVLSGWRSDDTFQFSDVETGVPRGIVKGSANNASAHDNGVKQFSERFGNVTIAPDPSLLSNGNATEASAIDEIVQLIDLIYSRPETVRHICWKLYRFFVYGPHAKYAPGNSVALIDQQIISSLAQTFISNGYKLLPVIEELLTSSHFYDNNNDEVLDDNFGGIIKSPLDLVIGTLRAFGFSIPDMNTNPTSFYEITGEILALINELGMPFYEPYDVAGYDAYHQWPIYHRSWITPASLARRYEFINQLFNVQNPGVLSVDPLQYVTNNFASVAGDARLLIIALAQTFLPVADNLSYDDAVDDTSALTAQRLNYFKERFLQGFDETYWTTRWANNAGDLKDQLAFLFNAMLQSPEYQLA